MLSAWSPRCAPQGDKSRSKDLAHESPASADAPLWYIGGGPVRSAAAAIPSAGGTTPTLQELSRESTAIPYAPARPARSAAEAMPKKGRGGNAQDGASTEANLLLARRRRDPPTTTENGASSPDHLPVLARAALWPATGRGAHPPGFAQMSNVSRSQRAIAPTARQAARAASCASRGT